MDYNLNNYELFNITKEMRDSTLKEMIEAIKDEGINIFSQLPFYWTILKKTMKFL